MTKIIDVMTFGPENDAEEGVWVAAVVEIVRDEVLPAAVVTARLSVVFGELVVIAVFVVTIVLVVVTMLVVAEALVIVNAVVVTCSSVNRHG